MVSCCKWASCVRAWQCVVDAMTALPDFFPHSSRYSCRLRRRQFTHGDECRTLLLLQLLLHRSAAVAHRRRDTDTDCCGWTSDIECCRCPGDRHADGRRHADAARPISPTVHVRSPSASHVRVRPEPMTSLTRRVTSQVRVRGNRSRDHPNTCP